MKDKKKDKRVVKKIITKMDILSRQSDEPNATDVLGSWTGTPHDGGTPVQDADDL